MTPRLETERLILRPFQAGDFEPLALFFADEDATRFIGGVTSRHRSHIILSALAGEWLLHGLDQWAVGDRTSGALAGFVGYINPPDWPEPEIGWTTFPAFQKSGYATEAARAARAELARLGAPAPLVSYVNAANTAPIRVAEKLGAASERQEVLRGEPLLVYRHPPEGRAA